MLLTTWASPTSGNSVSGCTWNELPPHPINIATSGVTAANITQRNRRERLLVSAPALTEPRVIADMTVAPWVAIEANLLDADSLRVVGIRARHRSFAGGATIAVLALSALALSPSALASKTGLYAQVNVKASNGYRVFIGAERWKQPRRRGKLFVRVQRKQRRVDSSEFSSQSVYMTHANLTRHHLRADLGKFGRIALHYNPRSQRQAMPPEALKAPQPGSITTRFFQRLLGCSVGFEVTRGVFKGRIRFDGEDGYTRVRAHQAHGRISPAQAQCSKVKPSHGVALDAGSGPVRFEADHYPHQKTPLFFAEEKDRVGKVAITRSALNVGGKGAFTFPGDLGSAHVAVNGGSIVGSGDLTSANQWTGSLAAKFPGDPHVALAGPDFTAQLGRF
jgi:hypothetical protein